MKNQNMGEIQANPGMNAHGSVKLMPLGLRWMFGWVWVLYSPRWKDIILMG